ncbi:hypothetical protein BTO06_10455 [Tenacibaculum sp. SZ-18]|uniref:hypothetical protein n=1 Tax=Tenacibaculum sp. SZ-18 TaxID=754423 RepID=UPI000CA32C3C|nr:hypothetical protein [Tenacibaculum sp. SZ-18]AUC15536.1 hypothetical protein BTO06_10455 [Tenacibaculum sp. SZ-18]
MESLKSILEFYINSSIHVAMAVYSLVRITEMYFGLPYNESLNYFIFYGTITGYNFVKYAGIAKLHHRSLTKNLRLIQIFSLFAFVLMIYYAVKLPVKILLFFTPFSLLTLFYAVPVFRRFSINLRSVATLKIIVIALVWTGVTYVIPINAVNELENTKVIVGFFQRFLFVVVLTLPFDIRDLRYDLKYLQTIPQLIGIERTKKVGFVLLAFTMVIEFFITPNHHFKFVYLCVFVMLLFFLQRAKRNQTKYYASFWVEGLPIIWWLILQFRV